MISYNPQLDKVRVSVIMPPEVSSCNVTTSLGKSSFDTTSKTLVWDIGHLETRSYPTLKGSVSFKINLLLAVISSVSVVKFVADRTELRFFP